MDEKELEKKRDNIVAGVKGFFSKNENEDENKEFDEFKEKREQLIKFCKEKKQWLIYLFLAMIIWFGAYIRTRNLGLLKDMTTGKFIPQALDPHLFLKYARYIVEHGALLAHDPTRFVPLGTSTVNYVFMSGFIAYLYKFIHLFVPSVTLEYIHIIYPTICFSFAMVFFFLLVRRLFDWKVGLLGTLFLSIVPAFLHRTMSGFSDHEALGILLMFMAMYFYVLGWQTKSMTKTLSWGLLAGIFTGFMGLSWGGWKFLILIISIFVLIEFFFEKISKKDVYQYGLWVIGFVIATTTWIPMFNMKLLFGSFTTGIAFLVLFMLIVDLVLFKYDLLKIKQKVKGKVPLSIISLVVSFIIGIGALMVILGPATLTLQVEEISDNLLHPLGNDRWQLTVAEQHQPYFTDWVGQFGPPFLKLKDNIFSGIPLYLTLFMLGSILLFYNMVKENKKRFSLTAVYIIFILAFVMSRHSAGSLFNGTNFISKLVYLGSLAGFAILSAMFFFKSYYKDKEAYKKIISWDKKYIFVLVWFLIMVVGARGAARLFFIFAPITALMAAYGTVELSELAFKIRKRSHKFIILAILLIVLLSPFTFSSISTKGIIPSFSESSLNQGKYSGPAYNQQWQITGSWARENVPENAVFGHWWDYGYWVQNGFQRATVLDGANKIKYWNYLMGRHVLTGQSQEEALEFLKVHKTTHYLIVADEIGKYTAYSSIGSDKNYDRYSWITTFKLNEKETKETRNSTILTYQGGYVLDDDFVWNGIVYPRSDAGIGAVFLPIKQIEKKIGNETVQDIEIQQPTVALIYQGKRTDVPLECVYFNGKMVKYDQPGLKGCFRLLPVLDGNGQMQNPLGAGLYVSEEGVNALWVNLYVFEQNNPDYETSAFKKIYDDSYLSQLVYIQGRVMGPMGIWEIEYPEGFTVDQETKDKYLGGNELLPDYFYDVN
jgi:asparagine N-glycosylation enzyme membrane subunit Stt3